jgi:hypothetical protein
LRERKKEGAEKERERLLLCLGFFEEDEVASTRIITDKIRLMAIQKFNDF